MPTLVRRSIVAGACIAVRPDLGPADCALVAESLTAEERRGLAQRPPGRRAPFLTGRWLLGQLIESPLGTPGAVSAAPCATCGGPHGPVRVADHLASVSHSAGRTAVALLPFAVAESSGVTAIGIDIEAEPEGSGARSGEAAARLGALLGARFADDASGLQRWTEVEAVLKADGRGLRVPPDRVRIDDVVPSDIVPVHLAPSDVAPRGVAPTDLTPVDLAPPDLAPVDLAPIDHTPVHLAPVARTPAPRIARLADRPEVVFEVHPLHLPGGPAGSIALRSPARESRCRDGADATQTRTGSAGRAG